MDGGVTMGHAAEAFAIEVRPGPSISVTLATPPAAPASTRSYRRVMDRKWNCDICNSNLIFLAWRGRAMAINYGWFLNARANLKVIQCSRLTAMWFKLI